MSVRAIATEDRAGAAADTRSSSTSSGTVRSGILSREQFLDQLEFEKRRADRSRAPLSLIVMTLPLDGPFDSDDVHDIARDLSFRKRATDFIGHLATGTIAFLLPYADAKAAETFSTMIVDMVGAPAAVISHATYVERRFDELVKQLLAATANAGKVNFGDARATSRLGLAIKRGVDIVGSLFLLVACSPLMAVVAVAVKLSSPGPIVFKQLRIGCGGVPFEFYKFRSMRAGSDDRVHREYVAQLIAGEHKKINQGNAHKPIYKLQSDSRITPVGRIIRKTSIDELPQLFNVLKGDMSLVGPRPPITYETERYQSWHMRRLQTVRPGITGLWQVEGRSKTAFDDMVRLDLLYIRNWSLWLDVKILLKTLVVVMRGDGAD